MFSVFTVCYCLGSCFVVGIRAINCLERLFAEMTYHVSSGTLNPTHSLSIFYQLSSSLWFARENVHNKMRLSPQHSSTRAGQQGTERPGARSCPEYTKEKN